MKFSKWIVSLIVVLNTLFAIGVLWVYLRVGSEPQVLVGAWFAFTTGELWLLSNIKREEIKEDCNDEQ